MKPLDQFYHNLDEPQQSCFMVLRDIILSLDDQITPEWKYKLPFFYFKGKMFCYLWKDKKTGFPYIGITKGEFLNHPSLVQGDRKKMKVLPINPNIDIPHALVVDILNEALRLYD